MSDGAHTKRGKFCSGTTIPEPGPSKDPSPRCRGQLRGPSPRTTDRSARVLLVEPSPVRRLKPSTSGRSFDGSQDDLKCCLARQVSYLVGTAKVCSSAVH